MEWDWKLTVTLYLGEKKAERHGTAIMKETWKEIEVSKKVRNRLLKTNTEERVSPFPQFGNIDLGDSMWVDIYDPVVLNMSYV